MFFSTYVLARKDSLATIWLAAHWDKKLTRQDLQKIDLNQSVIQIVHPEVPIALRTSGELLVGVVRVYALKVKHLLKDATDATMTVLRTGTVLVSSKGEILSGKGGVKAADAAAAAAVAPTSGSLLPSSSSSAAKNNAAAAGAGGGGDSGAAVTLHFAQGAEALREDDFYSILDVLQRQGEDGMLPHDLHHHATTTTTEADWFSVQPSQFLEVDVSGGLSTTDLLGAVVRGSDGRRSSGSSSKTSGGSSVEAARASTGAAGGPTTAAGDDAGLLFLDVGGALPDDLLAMGADGLADDMLMMRPSAGGAADLFDLTDPLAAGGGGVVSGEGGEGEVAAAAAAMPRKLKPVNVLDAQSTMMSKADLDKSVQDRSDVVASGDRRHGPLDAAEEAARRTLRTLTAAPTTVAVPLSSSFLPAGLAAVWAAAVQPSVQRALDVETARTSSNHPTAPHSTTTTTRLSGAAADPMLPDDDAFFAGGAAAPDSPLAQLDEAEAEPNNNNNAKTSSRKRGRDTTEGENDDASEEMGESALATLAKLRSAKSASTTFQQLLGSGGAAVGVDRATAAKTFVDVLALASRQMVRVQQKEPFGAIQIQLVRAQ